MKTLSSTISPGRLVLVAVVVLLFSFLPLLVSWRWDWLEAWVYAALNLGGLPAVNLPAEALALLIMLAGFGIGNYALLENRFFSGVVRIQKDRDHSVVTTGPYRWVRHPGYAGSLLVFFAIPVFLGSLWAFLPAVIVAIVLVLRTSVEDAVLQDELKGYREYAQKVRYRLVPGVW